MEPGSVVGRIRDDQGVFSNNYRIQLMITNFMKNTPLSLCSLQNMPGAVPRTSTLEWTNVNMTIMQVQIANKGYKRSLPRHTALLKGY